MSGISGFTKSRVEVSYWRVFHSIFPSDIGKYVICAPALKGFFEGSTSVCVMDDFGDLVRVEDRAVIRFEGVL